uniref:Uncharacterized protein n=1 Tax=Rhizophora mucronata TaxID=61149 RepID=A0A2P2N4Z2_RHIMU
MISRSWFICVHVSRFFFSCFCIDHEITAV